VEVLDRTIWGRCSAAGIIRRSASKIHRGLAGSSAVIRRRPGRSARNGAVGRRRAVVTDRHCTLYLRHCDVVGVTLVDADPPQRDRLN
jgi:hypothetical protein